MKLKKRITELKRIQLRTVFKQDAYGERYRDQEEWIVTYIVATARPSARFGHYLIDSLLINLLFVGWYFLTGFGDSFRPGSASVYLPILQLLENLPWLLIFVSYYGFFEIMWQKTPGKMITKTVVINEFAEKPDFGNLIIRTFARLIPFEAFSCLGDNGSRGWHDKLSNTWVVTESELVKIREMQEAELE